MPSYGFYRESQEEILKATHNMPSVGELRMIFYKTYVDAEADARQLINKDKVEKKKMSKKTSLVTSAALSTTDNNN